MLELHDLSLLAPGTDEDQMLLSEITIRIPRSHFCAVLGPSGCGKSTLLKVIAGLHEPTHGQLYWNGRDLMEDGDFDPHEIGYVPQFGVSYELLSVWENIEAALRLRVANLDAEEREQRIESILEDVGLLGLEDRAVRLLSGGQKRRLAMALELTAHPHILLCDEVTSGLDLKSEDEIVRLMRKLAHDDHRTIIHVTHSLRHLKQFDSVVVLYEGRVAYHGKPDTLGHYFDVEHLDDLFPRLAKRTGEEWDRSWQKRRQIYYKEQALDQAAAMPDPDKSAAEPASLPPPPPPPKLPDVESDIADDPEIADKKPKRDSDEPEEAPDNDGDDAKESHPHKRRGTGHFPHPASQLLTLLSRRFQLFLRDRGSLALQGALLLGFPVLVVIFAMDGLPSLQNLNAAPSGDFLARMTNELAMQKSFAATGRLVSGLIMFQVILLALMGANNSAREIASERMIFEKEKFAGLSPAAYVWSKAIFLGVIVLIQSCWMAFFVNWIVRFPGDFFMQALLLTLVNGSVTAICLGISSMMRSAEQSSLLSVYLVGFQLPLSGAVLALPGFMDQISRLFIASYWGWSGFIHTMQNTRFYEAMQSVTQTELSSPALCVLALTVHIILGLLLAYTGCKSSRWE